MGVVEGEGDRGSEGRGESNFLREVVIVVTRNDSG